MFFPRMQIVAAGFVLMCATSSAVAQAYPNQDSADFMYRMDQEIYGAFDVDAHLRALRPVDGPLSDRLKDGVGTSIGVRVPIGPIFNTPNDGSGSWYVGTGLDHCWFAGDKRVQLNQPGGKDFDIHDANLYLGHVKLGFESVVPVDSFFDVFYDIGFDGFSDSGSMLIRGVWVSGQLGGANAGISQAKFDPTKLQIINPGPVRDQAFVGGYEVGGKIGWQFRNGVEFDVHAGYGQLCTDFLQTGSSANGIASVGVGFSVPVPFFYGTAESDEIRSIEIWNERNRGTGRNPYTLERGR